MGVTGGTNYDFYDDSEEESERSYLSAKKRHAMLFTGKHVPNKNEAKLLRKLKADTGLTEEELRKHKKYRKLLSEAQRAKGTKNKEIREYKYLLKTVTRKLKLPKEHQDVVISFVALIQKERNSASCYFRKKEEFFST